MADTTPAEPRRCRPFLAAFVVLAALALAGGGFWAGRTTAPESAGPQAVGECERVRKAYRGLRQKVTTDAEPVPAEARTVLILIVQNPDCFNAETRATAQALLDEADAAATHRPHVSCPVEEWANGTPGTDC